MFDGMTILGKTIEYWSELQSHVGKTEEELLSEIAGLRAKVSFYEDRIKQMARFAKHTE